MPRQARVHPVARGFARPHQQLAARDHRLGHHLRRRAQSKLVRQDVGGAERHQRQCGCAVAASRQTVHHLVDRAVAACNCDHSVAAGVAGLGQTARITRGFGVDQIDRPAFGLHQPHDILDQPTPAPSRDGIADQQDGFRGRECHRTVTTDSPRRNGSHTQSAEVSAIAHIRFSVG
jgi:hypothetical protein